jgi:hypothetical protein
LHSDTGLKRTTPNEARRIQQWQLKEQQRAISRGFRIDFGGYRGCLRNPSRFGKSAMKPDGTTELFTGIFSN